jgi:hypothetical protein
LPYTFLWSPATSLNAANLPNPTAMPATTTDYSITVTTGNGCTTSDLVRVTVNYGPELGILPLNPTISCQNPTVTLVASAAQTFLWNTGETTQSILVNVAGIYSVIATGSNGCSSTSSKIVTGNSGAATANITPATAILSCANPTATLAASGGGTYLWSNNSTNSSITVAQSGTYAVTVTAANGCTAVASATVSGNSGAATGSISPATFVLNCTNTTTVLSASGPTGSTFLWSNGSNYYQINVGTAGIYTCTITNAGGCSVVKTANISSIYQTYYFDADSDGYGVATLTQSSCPQWINAQYWSLVAGDCAPNNPTSNPGAGEYCDGIDNNCNGQIDETTLNLNVTASFISCYGGTTILYASPTGGFPPYQYNFNWAGWQSAISKTLNAGTHQVAVRDTRGCQKIVSITVGQPPLLFISALNVVPVGEKYKVTVVVTGGTPNFTYRRSTGASTWSAWQTNNVFNNVPSGVFTFQVKDSKGCIASATTNCFGGGTTGGDRVTADFFGARREFDRARLQWITETEPTDAFYRIEKSIDGENFDLFLEKTPVNSRFGAQVYEVFDEKPSTGDNYYRLILVNSSGESRQSAIRKVRFDDLDAALWIYPNPTSGEIFIQPRGWTGESATLTISDLFGRTMKMIEIAQISATHPIELSMRDWADGAYFISFKTAENASMTRKVILTK